MGKSNDFDRSIAVSGPRASSRTLRPHGLRRPASPALARPQGAHIALGTAGLPCGAPCRVRANIIPFFESLRPVVVPLPCYVGSCSQRPAVCGENPSFPEPRPERPSVRPLATSPVPRRLSFPGPQQNRSRRDTRRRISKSRSFRQRTAPGEAPAPYALAKRFGSGSEPPACSNVCTDEGSPGVQEDALESFIRGTG